MPKLRFGADAYDSDSSDEEMPPLLPRSNSYDSDSSDKDTIESEDTSEILPLLPRLNTYDSDSSDEDTIETEKLISRLSRKNKKEGETVLDVVSEGEEEPAPGEVPSNMVVELIKRSGALNKD